MTREKKDTFNERPRGKRKSESSGRVRTTKQRRKERNSNADKKLKESCDASAWAYEQGKRAGILEGTAKAAKNNASQAELLSKLERELQVVQTLQSEAQAHEQALSKAIAESWSDAKAAVGEESRRAGYKEGYRAACESFSETA